MRVNFELKFSADTLEAAKLMAHEEVAKFLNIDESVVADSVDLELKVGIPDPEKNLYSGHFIITAYGSLKKSVLHPGT
jgi:hypothetical protein